MFLGPPRKSDPQGSAWCVHRSDAIIRSLTRLSASLLATHTRSRPHTHSRRRASFDTVSARTPPLPVRVLFACNY
ncbi:hypothetical protein DENSPDRAFT_846186 [Dentipellis sp. KUC8613]|nr:hypothetical protein DENSPDRAFT_846186 [Dentipellis sp. KUC8613]